MGMTENKRFTLSQNGTFHTVRDNVENKPLGVFEFKDDEFPVYACFHRIIDLMNNLSDENEQLKQDKKRLIGFLHRYKGVDVEDVDGEVLSKVYLDEWGELYHNER